MMLNPTSVPQYEFIQYITANNIVKSTTIAYNTNKMVTGDNMFKDNEEDIYTPTQKRLEEANKRFRERKKQGTTKSYNKYYKKLMKSYNDLRAKR